MAHSLGLLGDRWTLVLVREALDGATRYEHFRSRLAISDNTLSRKLRGLVDQGLFARDAETRTYRLTRAGADLAVVIAALGDWNQRWFPIDRPRRPPDAVTRALESLARGDS